MLSSRVLLRTLPFCLARLAGERRADPKAPVSHFRTPLIFEVFSPEGRFLGRVEFPLRARFIEAHGDLVWAIVRDENDLPAVARFRTTPGLH